MQAYQDFPDSRQRYLGVLDLASLLARPVLRRVGGMLKKDYGKGMQGFRKQHAVRLGGREVHLVITGLQCKIQCRADLLVSPAAVAAVLGMPLDLEVANTCEQLRRALLKKIVQSGHYAPFFFFHIARLYMHGARY